MVDMAKTSLIEREKKRGLLVKKYAPKRAALNAIIADQSRSEEERFQARLKLQQLPRNANPTRLRNRCELTGRGRGTTTGKRIEGVVIPGGYKTTWLQGTRNLLPTGRIDGIETGDHAACAFTFNQYNIPLDAIVEARKVGDEFQRIQK
jgi:small subunit ribosomal protein S14